MRPLAALLVLGGCEAVFPLEGPPPGVERRAVTMAQATGVTTGSIPRPAEVQDTDIVLIDINVSVDSGAPTATTAPSAVMIDHDQPTSCAGTRRHFLIYGGPAGPDQTYEFEFAAPVSFNAILVAYSNAARIESRQVVSVVNGNPPITPEINLEALQLAPRSVSVVVINSSKSLAAPEGMDLVLSLASMALYDLSTATGSVPGVTLALSTGQCPDVTHLSVEP